MNMMRVILLVCLIFAVATSFGCSKEGAQKGFDGGAGMAGGSGVSGGGAGTGGAGAAAALPDPK